MSCKYAFVILPALVIVACTPQPGAEAPATSKAATTVATAVAAPAKVVLIADLGEAGGTCGCAQMIRAARAAQGTTAQYEEHDARTDTDALTRFAVKEQPVVILLSSDGQELKRFEGEAPETVDAVKAALQQLPAKPS